MPQQLKRISKFSKANLLVVVLAFGGIGGYVLLSSSAAGGSPSVYWGAWMDGDTYSIGQGDAPWTSSTWDSFEQHAGKNVSMVHFGQPAPWTQAFAASPLDLTVARGAIPVVDMNSASTSLSSIASGTYDSSITTWANAVKAWGHPMMLRWDWEMNGTWFNWGAQAQASPANYVAAWRHFHDIVAAQGATNVTWVWCPNTEFSGSTALESLYPGDSYVDWTGLDGYNWGTNPLKPDSWKSFSQVVKPTYDHLLQISLKPIMLAETASTEVGGSKASWITDALSTQLPVNFPNIKAVLWFNWNITQSTGRMDWPIESSTAAQNAFASGIAGSYYAANTYGSLTNLTKVQPLSAVTSGGIAGDANNDSHVDITDLSILLSSYGTSNTPPDFNRDGLVSIVDLSILLSHYGQSSAAVQIPTSIASDCSVDVTGPILSWIASVPNNSTLSFGTSKCYRIEGTIEVQNRSGLTFEGNGSTFKSLNPMTSGVNADDQRAMWRAIDSTGFTFKDMTIIGAFSYTGSIVAGLQHAHAIDLRGTSAEVNNVNASNLGGDCVYFGLGFTSSLTASSGSYHDSSCSSISRNAVSVVAGNDIRVERVNVDRIGFDAFDVEPNVGAGNGSARVVFNNNTIGTYYLAAYSIVENAAISDQSFTNNHISGRGMKITIGPTGFGVVSRPRNVTITGNVGDIAQNPSAMNLDNVDILTVTGNTVPINGGVMLQSDNSCRLTVSGNSYPGGSTQSSITNLQTAC